MPTETAPNCWRAPWGIGSEGLETGSPLCRMDADPFDRTTIRAYEDPSGAVCHRHRAGRIGAPTSDSESFSIG